MVKELKQFDDEIKEVLIKEGNKVEVSPELYGKIESEINKNYIRRTDIMKKNILKRAAILAAVLCLGSATAFAASYVNSYVSIGGSTKAEYPTQGDMKAELGYSAKTVKEFSNGFHFSDYGINTTSALDAENNKIGDFKELTLRYTKKNTDNKNPLCLIISKPIENEAGNDKGIKITQNNVEFTYEESLYKFVPVDYKLTKEDQEKLDAGEIEISYGSDKVEKVNYQFLSWKGDDGISYRIMAADYGLTQEALLQMAEEVIQQ